MKKPKPIHIITDTDKMYNLYTVLNQMPMTRLKELLRLNSIPIPKMKNEMVIRLVSFMRRENRPVKITIG